MAARGFRIVIKAVAVFFLLLAVILVTAALCSPWWQWAYLEQVDQLHYLGLWQKCVYGSRQGPTGPRQWQCTFIPFQPQMFRTQMMPSMGGTLNSFDITANTNRVDYTAFGGESWRLATLILLILGAIAGFFSLVFEIVAICLDIRQTVRLLKIISGLSLGLLVFATFCTAIGVIVFARNSQESENLYMLELTAFAIQQLGTSFYLGVGAAFAFFLALIIDLCSTVLTFITARRERNEYRTRLYQTAESDEPSPSKLYKSSGYPPPPEYQSPPVKIRTAKETLNTDLQTYDNPPMRKIPLNEKLNINIPTTVTYQGPKSDNRYYSNNAKPENSTLVRTRSLTIVDEEIVWKYPKMTQV